MAIKNKVKPDQYTEDLSKAISPDKIKSESFAAIKMLLKKGYDVKTSFFVKAGHFKGDKVKYGGHFLAIGDSPALSKKFKLEKTAPTVAYGNLFVKKIKDQDVVHFEYVGGQGKLKKPADWKKILKEFKKMLKKKCAFVIDGQMVEDEDSLEENKTTDKETSSDSTTEETLTEKLERKAKKAEDLLVEVESIKDIYDRDKKEKLYRKTTKWLDNYAKLSDQQQTPALKSHFPKIQKAHTTVKDILSTDNQITKNLDQVFAALEKFMAMEDHKAPKAQKYSQQISAALDKVMPLIKKVKDKNLLQECKEIQELLTQ